MAPVPIAVAELPRDIGHADRYDDSRADDVDRWAWWLFATLDDPASWHAYLTRRPPPPAWQATLARDPYRELERTPR